MVDNEIDIGIWTETHINTNNKEATKQFTYYFSGGDTKEHHHAGVAIIIANKLNNFIDDIQQISERLMTITLKCSIPITIIATYAHTAQHELTDRMQLYNDIKQLYNKYKSKHIVHIAGDFNARIQTIISNEEICIGPHTFDKK